MEGPRQGRYAPTQTRKGDPASASETWAWSTHAAAAPRRGLSRAPGGVSFPDQVGSTRVLSAASGDGASVAGLELHGRSCRVEEDDEMYALFMAPPLPKALVQWKDVESVRIDRFDARHLLDVLPQPKKGAARRKKEDPQIEAERYADLALLEEEHAKQREEWERRQGGTGAEAHSASYYREGYEYGQAVPAGETTRGSGYSAVPFTYGAGAPDAPPSGKGEEAQPAPLPFTVPLALPQPFPHETPSTEKHYNIMVKTARFVAQHGGQSEIVLRVKQGHVPTFSFLMPGDPLHPFFRYIVENPDVLQAAVSGAQVQPKLDAAKVEPDQAEKVEEQMSPETKDGGTGSREAVGVKEGTHAPQDGVAPSRTADAISLLGNAYADEEGDEDEEVGEAGDEKEMVFDGAGAVPEGAGQAAGAPCSAEGDQEAQDGEDLSEQGTETDKEEPQRDEDEVASAAEASGGAPGATKARVTMQLKEMKRKKAVSGPDQAPGPGGIPAWAKSKRLKQSVPQKPNVPESTEANLAKAPDEEPSTVDQGRERDVQWTQAAVEGPEAAAQTPQLQQRPVAQEPEPSVEGVEEAQEAQPSNQGAELAAPEDEAAVKVIMTMVEYIARNGPQFEKIVRDKDEQQAKALKEQQPEGGVFEEWAFRRFAFLEPTHPHHAFFIAQLRMATGGREAEHTLQEQDPEKSIDEGRGAAAPDEINGAEGDRATASGAELHAGPSLEQQEAGLVPGHQDEESTSSGSSAYSGETDSEDAGEPLDLGPGVVLEESPRLPKLSAAAVAAAVRAATSRQSRRRNSAYPPDDKQLSHNGLSGPAASTLPTVDADTEALLEGDGELMGRGVYGSQTATQVDGSEERERKRKERLAKARLLLKGGMAPSITGSDALTAATIAPMDASRGKSLERLELEEGEIGDDEQQPTGKSGGSHDTQTFKINGQKGNDRRPIAASQPVSRLRALRQELEREDDESEVIAAQKEWPKASKQPGPLTAEDGTAETVQTASKQDIDVPLDLRSKVRQMLQGLKSGL